MDCLVNQLKNKAMKALVVGCGSIGRRHIKNLSEFKKVKKIYVYTRLKNCINSISCKKGKIEILDTLADADVDFAIVCNETCKHIDAALLLAKKGINLFIEKPIAHNLKKINLLKRIVRNKRIKLFVGYNLRFLKALNYIKKQLASNALGNLYFAKIEAGQYLPQWRGGVDYRNSYSSHQKKGGGVSLDLSHEIDYMRYLFRDPLYWKTIKARVGELEINSDDIFEGLYVFQNNFICAVHLDYLQRGARRNIRIEGSKGTLVCDFVKKEIRIKKNNAKEIVFSDSSYFDIEKTYVDELRYFMSSIENNSEPCISLSDGVEALRLIEDTY